MPQFLDGTQINLKDVSYVAHFINVGKDSSKLHCWMVEGVKKNAIDNYGYKYDDSSAIQEWSDFNDYDLIYCHKKIIGTAIINNDQIYMCKEHYMEFLEDLVDEGMDNAK